MYWWMERWMNGLNECWMRCLNLVSLSCEHNSYWLWRLLFDLRLKWENKKRKQGKNFWKCNKWKWIYRERQMSGLREGESIPHCCLIATSPIKLIFIINAFERVANCWDCLKRNENWERFKRRKMLGSVWNVCLWNLAEEGREEMSGGNLEWELRGRKRSIGRKSA